MELETIANVLYMELSVLITRNTLAFSFTTGDPEVYGTKSITIAIECPMYVHTDE